MRRVRASAAILLLLSCLGPLPAQAQGDGSAPRLLPLPSPPRGLHFGLNWDSDIYANVHGGRKRGYATDSVLTAALSLDTGKLGWWQGGQFALGVRAITSTHPSRYVGDIQAVSNLDAPNLRQVNQFWYSQTFGPSLVRAGLMDLNNFFDANDTAGLFTNASFGITPTLTGDVPTDTYPYSAWGAMAHLGARPEGWQVGVFQGDPANRSSALRGGEMLIGERDWHLVGSGLQLGIGAWYRRAPSSSGLPASDWGSYANLQQPLPGHPGTRVFLQAGASPSGTNPIPAYLGGGIRFQDVSSTISDIGFGFARAWIRGHAAETSVEATARLPLFGGSVALQPDLQYVFHPSGTYPNALAIALRLHVTLY